MPQELTLPEAVRSIRKAWHMTTSEFARELGVAQSVVSRYESGARSPGRRVLLRLMLKAHGAQRETIRLALSTLHGKPVRDAEAVGWAVQIAKEEEFFERAAAHLALTGRERFIYLAGQVVLGGEEVDESLNTVLSTWLMSEHSPDRPRYFRDAARFLEIGLVPGAGETNEPLLRALNEAGLTGKRTDQAQDEGQRPGAGIRRSYRVTLPVDLGDGIVHPQGEMIDLDLATAKLHARALIEVESVRRSKKKSA